MQTIQPQVMDQVMKPSTAAAVAQMMKKVVDEGTGTPAQLGGGIEFAGQDRHRLGRHRRVGAHPAVVHRLRAAEQPEGGDRGDDRALPGRVRRHGGGADRQGRRAAAPRPRGAGRCPSSPTARSSTAATRCSPASGPAGWPRCTWPRTGSSGARSRSSCCTGASPRTRTSSSASAARRRRRPASSTRTSSASTTAASGTAPTTSRWSTCPGPSLKALIRQEAPLAPLRAIDIGIQILKAARFAHRQGIIHRDFKPHNVIVSDGDHVKVTDFGIARAGASDMTETGSIMGTAQYLSPEQAQGHCRQPRLGPVLGRRDPLRDAHRPACRSRPTRRSRSPSSTCRSRRPRRPSSTPSIPPELEQIVLWALNKNPADRPPDADALIVGAAGGPERDPSRYPVRAHRELRRRWRRPRCRWRYRWPAWSPTRCS